MSRPVPIKYILELGTEINITVLDTVDNPVNTIAMSCQSPKSTGAACKLPQCMVDHTPKFENSVRKGRRPNQVIGKKGMIRKDKRIKPHYF